MNEEQFKWIVAGLTDKELKSFKAILDHELKLSATAIKEGLEQEG